MIVTSPYEPRRQLLPFNARKERFAILVCHRRFGKTVGAINDLVDKAVQCTKPMQRYGYVAPFYSQAKSIAWAYLKFYAKDLIAKTMESELSVLLVNGALIRLHGADNPDSLRGVYWDGIVLDEFGDMAPRVYTEIILPSLLDRQGWVVFIGTPKGPNHFYDLWKDALEKPEWYTQMIKASESGIIAEVDLALARSQSDENTYAQEFECSFTAAIRGAYYAELINKLEGTNHGIYDYDPNKAVHLAFDIGYTDDTSIWFFQTNGQELAVIDFFTASNNSVADIMQMLRTKPYAYGTFYLPHDAKNKSFQTGKSTRELMIADGATCQLVPSLSIQDGIQAVRVSLPKWYFNTANPDVRYGLTALKLYQREWDDKKKIFKDAPLHNWTSNPADAVRYMALATNPASAVRQSQPLKTVRPQVTVVGNVLTLENLYADRKRQVSSGRIE